MFNHNFACGRLSEMANELAELNAQVMIRTDEVNRSWEYVRRVFPLGQRIENLQQRMENLQTFVHSIEQAQ